MARKKKLTSTADLAADAANPRTITDEAAEGLAQSIERFGDLSGIVFNKRTGELVTGHQRVAQIRGRYGDVELTMTAGDRAEFQLDGRTFAVRVVDWSRAEQRAANVAANSQKLQGEFTDDLAAYLLAVETELSAAQPGAMEDLLLDQLLAEASADEAATDEEKPASEPKISERYQVVVDCTDEEHQRTVYDQLTGEGLSCKVLTL